MPGRRTGPQPSVAAADYVTSGGTGLTVTAATVQPPAAVTGPGAGWMPLSWSPMGTASTVPSRPVTYLSGDAGWWRRGSPGMVASAEAGPSVDPGERARALAVACVVARAAVGAGVALDDGLAIWALAGRPPPTRRSRG